MLNTATTGKDSGLVQSVGRALDILELLGRAEGGLGVTELARRLELKTPTAHNLLRTLSARGYAAKGEDQRYRLSCECGRLGGMYLDNLRVPEIARPAIEELALDLNESVILGMMVHGEIAFVARASGSRMLSVNFEPSVVRFGYTSVCGRVVLAHLDPEALEAYVASHPVAKSHCEDIRSRRDLDQVLARARRDGYLDYWRENNTVLAIAAPIRDYTDKVVAAVGLGMPGVRFRKSHRSRIIKAVQRTASVISSELGYGGGEGSPA
jgi:DNA-binding IclR family transcriptional regulator